MYDVITGHKNIYVNNSSQNRDRAVDEVSLCLSRQDASNDMMIRSTWAIYQIRSNFQIDLSGSVFTCFDASWREECDGVKRFSLSFLVQKLLAKNLIFPKKHYCLTCPGNVKMWPKVVKSGMVRFRTWRSFRVAMFCLCLCCEALFQLGGKRAEGSGGCPSPPGAV